MTYADLAQILQNRIIVGLRAGRVVSDSLNQPQRPDLEVYVAALEKAVPRPKPGANGGARKPMQRLNASRPSKPMLPRCRKPSPRPKP